jgi:galactonate dehydratase
MQITGHELFAVPPRWLLLRLETSDGLVGWGEATLPGRLAPTEAAVSDLVEEYLVGEDPLRIERHWRTMYQGGYHRGGPVLMSALAGIDHALWDIKGKHHGCPVYDLLGGHVRDRLLVHQWIGSTSAGAVDDAARRRVDQGYRALKMNTPARFRSLETPAEVGRVAERVAAVRDAVGDAVHVGVDFHGRVAKPMVRPLLEALEPYDLMFVDQPLLPEHMDALAAVERRTTVPLSTGERLHSRYEFRPLLVSGVVSVVQPDVAHAGGITELRKIATMAEAFDVAVVPHSPLSPVAFAASLQVGFATHNVVMQEQDLSLHEPESSQALAYLAEPSTFEFADGHVSRPTAPGLGIEVDEAYVRERAEADVNWHNPVWHHEDGSLAEW